MKKPACLLDGCEEERYCRGLCDRDYEALHRLVTQEKITWETAVEKKLCLPTKYVRRIHQFLEEG